MTDSVIGVVWRAQYVRCCTDCFDKPYLIERMKASANNIKPVIVLDIITKKCKAYLINETMTDFDELVDTQAKVYCRKIEKIANYAINKKNIQLSNLTPEEKSLCCRINESKHRLKRTINEKLFESLLKKAQLVERV